MAQHGILIDINPNEPPAASYVAEPLVSFSAPASVEAEQYRSLRHAIERLRREKGVQVIAITSPGAGDGKTVTTLNLAGSLAQASDVRVLVVSADLRGERVIDYLGLKSLRSPGLGRAVLDSNIPLAKAAVRIDPLNISVLPAGNDGTSRPYELLTSPRFKALLDEARLAYDYILVDTPPVVPVADARLIASSVDGFLMVVSAHRTPKKLLAEALSLLNPAPIFGLVFNGDDQPLSSYYHYYGSVPRPRRAA
jgi:protein-tyrosine kinase